MQINLETKIVGLDAALKAIEETPKKGKYATVKAINTSMEWAKTDIGREMRKVFERPTPFFLKSLRLFYATPTNMTGQIGYKDAWSSSAGETGGRNMVEPHVYGGMRQFKGMEVRLLRAGFLPKNYNVVPGGGATIDGYGNMSAGQITQILNVLQTYTEGGYNTANSKTAARLAKGNKKKNIYGFVYWVNRVGSRNTHLQPGVYKRVATPWGSSLVPMLIFVKRALYQKRLDFYGIGYKAINTRFAGEFDKAWKAELAKTAPAIAP